MRPKKQDADRLPKQCEAVTDEDTLSQAAEARLRVEELEAINAALKDEVTRRKASEQSLRESRHKQASMLAESKRMQEELRMLSHQVLHSQEEERKRISHDLHDEIAQTLAAIHIHLDQLARDAALNPEDLAEEIVFTQKLVETSVESVHRFAVALRPSQLDDLGFLPALQGYVDDFSRQTQIPVRLTGAQQLRPMADSASVVLFRIAQAALTNSAQHAKATQIEIKIRQDPRSLKMTISDNGISFDTETVLGGSKVERLGIIGMRERVEMIGGKFSIQAVPGEGTTIGATLPVEPNIASTPPFATDE